MGAPEPFAVWSLEQEARALLCRLGRVQSFALQETMVPAASLSVEAQAAIERFLVGGRRALHRQVRRFIAWLGSPAARRTIPAELQRRFTLLRLRFNIVLAHFDIFSEALSQRSEAENGVWLAGLDIVARDALELPGIVDAPPVICYLARGAGAAIRRARTRLPGGASNPVSIIRVPRERMVGTGIASSLVHEVGHQGAALLDLVTSLREDMRQGGERAPDAERGPRSERDAAAWSLWRKWLSEIVADLWSVTRLGVTATAGLIGVVSLPAAFVFRIDPDDPHPAPYMRVKLSAALGEALYPHPQWRRLTRLWESFYDVSRVPAVAQEVFAALERTMPALVQRLLNHRSSFLAGRTLGEALYAADRQPAALASLYRRWQANPGEMGRAPPTLVFAVLGQARFEGHLTPELESELLSRLLRHWAWRSTVDVAEVCAGARRQALPPPPPPPRPEQQKLPSRLFLPPSRNRS